MGIFDRFKKKKEQIDSVDNSNEKKDHLKKELESGGNALTNNDEISVSISKTDSSEESFGSSLSISNTISKDTAFESSELSSAYFDDLKNRNDDTISNERIQSGDIILDTYQVTSDAISGGMGSVWRVHHNSWNTDLAMKRPQPRFFAEGGNAKKAQFVAECENWINLGLHPNIVSCYYVREIGGVPTIFSEWMDGSSLSDRIKDGSLYEGTEEEIQERILDIAIQAARGLQYSHENGLIHQDFKPGNLLLTKEWDAKVADFGLAKAKSNLDDDSNTAKTTGYTLAYCPQEQVDREEPQKWMDVYSWALTVLEMYVGKRLWQTGAEAKEHIDKYWQRCKYAVPDKMQVILNTCLTEKPDDFDYVVNKTVIAYCDVTEIEYPRQSFTGVTVSAESLNNKALSFLDLKKSEEAEKCWKLALENNSNHVESIYNELIYRWKRGEITDVEVLKRIRNADDGSIAAMMYQLQIQIARCDKLAYRCIEIIQKDRNLQPNSPEAKELNRLIRICDEIICESHSNVETVADSEYHPKMALSSIRSYEEQLRYDNEFSSLLQSASQEYIKGDKKEAVRRMNRTPSRGQRNN